MLKALKIEKTMSTPEVELDKEKNSFYLKGDILPENVYEFFGPIYKWIREYAKSPLDSTVLKFSFNIINTSSSKYIILIIKELEKIAKKGKKVTVILNYPADDEIMDYMSYEMSIAFPSIKIIKKTFKV